MYKSSERVGNAGDYATTCLANKRLKRIHVLPIIIVKIFSTFIFMTVQG